MPGAGGGEVKDGGDGSYTGAFSADRCGPAALPVVVRVNGVDVAPAGLSVAFPCAPLDVAASGVSVAAAHARAGDDVRVTVAATNACGEPARGRAVAIAEDLGAPVAPSGVTDAAGMFTTTIRARGAGADRVAATVDGIALPAVAITWDAPHAGGCGSAGDGAAAAVDALALAAAIGALRRRRQAPTPTGQDTPVPPRPQ
jgi:hypothetical protein